MIHSPIKKLCIYNKYRYNEVIELKKDNWEELNWEFVSSKVIHEMIKKGLTDASKKIALDKTSAKERQARERAEKKENLKKKSGNYVMRKVGHAPKS